MSARPVLSEAVALLWTRPRPDSTPLMYHLPSGPTSVEKAPGVKASEPAMPGASSVTVGGAGAAAGAGVAGAAGAADAGVGAWAKAGADPSSAAPTNAPLTTARAVAARSATSFGIFIIP